jgi:hypothetical protein
MTLTLFIWLLIALAAGIGIGAGGYRYTLKRNPAKLQALAAAIKAKARRVEDEMRDAFDKGA